MKETDPEGVAPRRWGATPSGSVRFVILFRGLRSDARASSLTPAITFIPFGDFQSFFRTASCVLQDIFQIQLQARGSGVRCYNARRPNEPAVRPRAGGQVKTLRVERRR